MSYQQKADTYNIKYDLLWINAVKFNAQIAEAS